LEFTEKSCDVYPFSEEYEPLKQIPVAKLATAFDYPITRETFILVFGQALYLGDQLKHILICPSKHDMTLLKQMQKNVLSASPENRRFLH